MYIYFSLWAFPNISFLPMIPIRFREMVQLSELNTHVNWFLFKRFSVLIKRCQLQNYHLCREKVLKLMTLPIAKICFPARGVQTPNFLLKDISFEGFCKPINLDLIKGYLDFSQLLFCDFRPKFRAFLAIPDV